MQVSDYGLLDAAVARPRTTAFGLDAYPDNFAKAEAMGDGPDRGLPTWVAAILLVLYAAVGAVMLIEARHDANLWTKEVHLFDALTPIATGAVGWIFGREVHRKAAADYKEAADNGKKLAGAVKCMGRLPSADAQDRLDNLVTHAVKLFPDQTDPDQDSDN